MQLIMQGHQHRFELENVIRLFLPQEKVRTGEEPAAAGEPVALARLEKRADITLLTCRLTVGNYDRTREAEVDNVHPAYETECEFLLADCLYRLLEEWTGIRPPWGSGDGRAPGQAFAPFDPGNGRRKGGTGATRPSSGQSGKTGSLPLYITL